MNFSNNLSTNSPAGELGTGHFTSLSFSHLLFKFGVMTLTAKGWRGEPTVVPGINININHLAPCSACAKQMLIHLSFSHFCSPVLQPVVYPLETNLISRVLFAKHTLQFSASNHPAAKVLSVFFFSILNQVDIV